MIPWYLLKNQELVLYYCWKNKFRYIWFVVILNYIFSNLILWIQILGLYNIRSRNDMIQPFASMDLVWIIELVILASSIFSVVNISRWYQNRFQHCFYFNYASSYDVMVLFATVTTIVITSLSQIMCDFYLFAFTNKA